MQLEERGWVVQLEERGGSCSWKEGGGSCSWKKGGGSCSWKKCKLEEVGLLGQIDSVAVGSGVNFMYVVFLG